MLLKGAMSASWRGDAAGGYSAATEVLMAQAQTMAENDDTMTLLVNNHAKHVSRTQLNIGIFQDTLVVIFLIIRALEVVASTKGLPGLIEVAYAVALLTCPPFVGAGAGEFASCLAKSIDAADQATEVDYSAVALAARQVIEHYSVAVFAETSTLESPPDGVRGSQPERTPFSALNDREIDASDVGVTSALEVPYFPASTTASGAQGRSAPGPPANLPGGSPTPGSYVNQQRPLIPSTQAVRSGDLKDSEGRPATSAGERAPADVTAAGYDPTLPQASPAQSPP